MREVHCQILIWLQRAGKVLKIQDILSEFLRQERLQRRRLRHGQKQVFKGNRHQGFTSLQPLKIFQISAAGRSHCAPTFSWRTITPSICMSIEYEVLGIVMAQRSPLRLHTTGSRNPA